MSIPRPHLAGVSVVQIVEDRQGLLPREGVCSAAEALVAVRGQREEDGDEESSGQATVIMIASVIQDELAPMGRRRAAGRRRLTITPQNWRLIADDTILATSNADRTWHTIHINGRGH